MDHFPRYLSTVLLCLAFPTVLAFGQNDWDAVLERYESISRQCLELRARVTAGEAVADRSVAGLLQELARLKSTLQDASGTMTPAQRRCFIASRSGMPRSGNFRRIRSGNPRQDLPCTAVSWLRVYSRSRKVMALTASSLR